MAKFSVELAAAVIERLKLKLGIPNDLALSKYLGIKQQTLSTWRSRGSVDVALIIAKCEHISLDYLFKGNESNTRDNLNIESLKKENTRLHKELDICTIEKRALAERIYDIENKGEKPKTEERFVKARPVPAGNTARSIASEIKVSSTI